MIDVLIFVGVAFVGACGAMRLLENLPHYRHQREQRAMVRRVEARRRWVEQRGSFPSVTERRR